jgi:hypothetical protein
MIEYGVFRKGGDEHDAPLGNQAFDTSRHAHAKIGVYRDGHDWLEVRSREVTPWAREEKV